MGMGRPFHHWGVREQFLWGWGGRSTTGERGSSSYGDVGGRSTTGERGSSSYGDGEAVPPLGSEGEEAPSERQVHGWQDGRDGLWQQSGVVELVCRLE